MDEVERPQVREIEFVDHPLQLAGSDPLVHYWLALQTIPQHPARDPPWREALLVCLQIPLLKAVQVQIGAELQPLADHGLRPRDAAAPRAQVAHQGRPVHAAALGSEVTHAGSEGIQLLALARLQWRLQKARIPRRNVPGRLGVRGRVGAKAAILPRAELLGPCVRDPWRPGGLRRRAGGLALGGRGPSPQQGEGDHNQQRRHGGAECGAEACEASASHGR
mmetsp:Transcript_64499/g.197336  ORF Transcript_64499/g.197336 Transcript_64499/m.197336 type:complete len:221 (+) Transcript_64499:791-1453(+)